MDLYYKIVLFILGTIFGSFFNVVGSRLPNGESIVSPPSHCGNCKKTLTWKELFPILSFLFQRGRCKYCKVKLSWEYPLYEIATGLLFTLCYQVFGMNLELLIALTFVSILLILLVSDYHYLIIPDEVLAVGGILLSLEILIIRGYQDLLISLISGICAFLIMYIIKKTGDFIFKKESMGGGDIKLMIIIGMMIGIPFSVITVFLASFIALPISLVILYQNDSNVVPFGPFLSIASFIIYISQIDIQSLLNIFMY